MKNCSRCKQSKNETEFNKKKIAKDGLAHLCRECSNKVSKEHYKQNKEDYIRRAKIYKPKGIKKCKEFVNNLKMAGCSNCDEKDIRCLDFHHIDAKTKVDNVSNLVCGSMFNAVNIEVQKCILLCANCHRKLHTS